MKFSNWLENKEDWKTEGYTIHHNIDKNNIIVFAKDTNGDKVARAAFIIKDDKLRTAPGNIVHVDKDHRRKGLATEMYKYAEKITGKKIVITHTTGEGGKFWDQLNRPFGVESK